MIQVDYDVLKSIIPFRNKQIKDISKICFEQVRVVLMLLYLYYIDLIYLCFKIVYHYHNDTVLKTLLSILPGRSYV